MSDARGILNARLAAGEITEEEYDRIAARLDRDADKGPAPRISTRFGRDTNAPPIARLPEEEPIEPVSPSGLPGPSRRRSYLARLWLGEISLPVTYWVWGSLVSGIIGLICMGVAASGVLSVIAVAGIVLIVWVLFMTVAIFRSAGAYKRRYPRKRVWGWLAQIAVILGLMSSFGNVMTSLDGMDDDTLNRQLAALQSGTPKMIDSHMRLDTVTRDNAVFIYHFTVIGPSHVPTADEIASDKAQTIQHLCGTADTRQLLNKLDGIEYVFNNEAGSQLVNYTVSKTDCH